MRERVVPTVLVQRTVLGVTHGVLPLIACGKVSTFHDTSAGEAEDARVKILEVLHKVSAQSVPVVFGEERYVVEVDRLTTFKEDAEQAFLQGLVSC
jgi:hypothetical protein